MSDLPYIHVILIDFIALKMSKTRMLKKKTKKTRMKMMKMMLL